MQDNWVKKQDLVLQDNWVKKYSYVLQAHCEKTVPCIARYIFTIHEGILQCKGYIVDVFH